MLLVFITVGVRKPLSANKPPASYTRVEGRAKAAGDEVPDRIRL